MVNRREDNPFKYLLGMWVKEPINFSLALEILDRLYWTRSPKPNVLQKAVKDLTNEIFKKHDNQLELKLRIETYKLESLSYIKRHFINKKMYVLSINQKGIDFLNYQTSSIQMKIELEKEWGSFYIKNEIEINTFIDKDLLK